MKIARLTIHALLSLAAAAACAQAPDPPRPAPLWFDISGPSTVSSGTDTVELDLSEIANGAPVKEMRLRVSLSSPRARSDGESYASYSSDIEIDCAAGSIEHRRQTRFTGNRWTGRATEQVFAERRPMAFAGLTPDPKPRVLKAACPE